MSASRCYVYIVRNQVPFSYIFYPNKRKTPHIIVFKREKSWFKGFCAPTVQIKVDLFCIVFSFHYLCGQILYLEIMFTKNLFWMALIVMGAVSINVSGQNETVRQKYERLAKEADANPTDWKKQYEAAHMLLDKNSELYDQIGAGKYYERIYHMVADINSVVPDSVFNEASITLMFNAMNHEDVPTTVFYGDELKRYTQLKNDKESTMPMLVNTMEIMLQLAQERPMSAGDMLSEVRKELTQRQFQGVENTDVTMAVIYEQIFDDYLEFAKNKLMEITLDGKPYVVIAQGAWNVEQPFMGWLADAPDSKMLFYGEDGRVYDDLHGQMLFNFHWSEESKAVVKSEDTNTRLITVTPEQRQKYVEAYRKYMKK